MRKKVIGFALSTMLFALCFQAEAQQPKKIPRIGYLSTGSSSDLTRVGAFRQGLRELGYIEGQNIFIEYRYAEGKPDRLFDLATELVRLKVDILVSGGGNAGANAAKQIGLTIPPNVLARADKVIK